MNARLKLQLYELGTSHTRKVSCSLKSLALYTCHDLKKRNLYSRWSRCEPYKETLLLAWTAYHTYLPNFHSCLLSQTEYLPSDLKHTRRRHNSSTSAQSTRGGLFSFSLQWLPRTTYHFLVLDMINRSQVPSIFFNEHHSCPISKRATRARLPQPRLDRLQCIPHTYHTLTFHASMVIQFHNITWYTQK